MVGEHCFRIAFSRIVRLGAPIGLALILAGAFSLFLKAENGQGAENAEITVCETGCDYDSLQLALDHANEDDSILISPGTYTEVGKIYITQTLTIEAADANNRPVIMPAQDTGSGAGADRAWIVVDPGVTLTLRNLVLDGGSQNIIEAIQLHGTGVIEGNEFRNIEYGLSTSPPDLLNSGTAIFLDHTGTIRNNTFQNIGRVGALACGPDANMTFEGNTYFGKNTSNRLDVGAWVAGGAQGEITQNSISGNIGGDQDMSSAGVRVDATSLMCQSNQPSTATVNYNTLLNSKIGIFVGGEHSDGSTIIARFNRIVGNETAGILDINSDVLNDAQYNWWGCNAGPGNPDCDKAVGNIDTEPPLQLSISASPAAILKGEQAGITASIRGGTGYAPDGTPVTFSSTNLGSVTPSSATLSSGDAQTTFTAGNETGTATVSAEVDNQTVLVQISINSKISFVYFPSIMKPIANGDFNNGLAEWEHGKGPFVVDGGPHGSGLPQSVVSVNGNNVALLGNPSFTDGSIPVGYGYIAKNFNVVNNSLEFEYHLITFDIAVAKDGYYDTLEVSVNTKPDQIINAQRNAIGCPTPDNAPQIVKVTAPGLAFCTGGTGTGNTKKDYGLQNLSLDLSAFKGQNVTVYFTLWSREYGSSYYDDHAFYNTWVTIDNVRGQ
jgi:hypothetical protein